MDITIFIPASASKSTSNIKRIVQLIESIRENLSLKNERKIIACDGYGDIRESLGREGRAKEINFEVYETFKRNLKDYIISNPDCEIVEFEKNVGLNATTTNVMSLIKTPLVFNCQHDFKIIRKIEIRPIIEEMLTKNTVKHLRFNKRQNVAIRWDKILEPDKNVGFPALKTSCWTDNPHFMKREHFNEFIRPLINKPGFPEETINPLYQKEIDVLGFSEAHAKFGTYIYGNINDPPMVSHA